MVSSVDAGRALLCDICLGDANVDPQHECGCRCAECDRCGAAGDLDCYDNCPNGISPRGRNRRSGRRLEPHPGTGRPLSGPGTGRARLAFPVRPGLFSGVPGGDVAVSGSDG